MGIKTDIRNQREAEQRESLATTIRSLRSSDSRQTFELVCRLFGPGDLH